MIDSHCHLDFKSFDDDREQLLLQCADSGIEAVVVPGIEPAQWSRLIDLQQSLITGTATECKLAVAIGLHPWWVDRIDLTPPQFERVLRQQLQEPHWSAIGECGLDGAIDCPLALQEEFLKIQLQLAEEIELPLILHGHRAHQKVIAMLKQYTLSAGGVIHGFSGSVELAKQYWQLGFYIGVGGTITYPRAAKTRKAIAAMPLESLLLETDAPDMPLSGFQGERNSPLQLPKVAACLAQLKSINVDQVAAQTSNNSRQLFGL